MSEMPKWLKPYLSSQDLQKIETTITNVEKFTSAELVPVIVRRSSTIGHVPLILALIGFIVILFFDQWLADSLLSHLGWWVRPAASGMTFLILLLLVRLLSPRPWLCRWLTPLEDQIEQVENRAELEFFESKIHETSSSTGILIFISLLERQVVVLADKAISDRHPRDTWSQVIAQIIAGIKNENLAQGLCRGIEICGEILRQDFPGSKDDKNELANHLIIRDK